MALSIENAEVERLARELMRTTGESLTLAITRALRDRLARETRRTDHATLRADLRHIREEFQKLPVLDNRPGDEIIAYDKRGLPA